MNLIKKEETAKIIFILFFIVISISLFASSGGGDSNAMSSFPKSLETYHDLHMATALDIIINRIKVEPFNLIATLIFFLAIIHSFMSSWFLKIAHKLEHSHREKQKQGLVSKKSMHIGAGALHFLGEIETVFGVWVIGLGVAVTFFYDWHTFVTYVGTLHYVEPMFVVVVMTIASSRPILKMFELILWKLVKLLGGTLEAWWFIILTIGPLLGSFITEPAAMTISAYLLADKFYDLRPSNKLKYSTIALLFVNVSVGGTLTNFAAPPVLMVSAVWDWDLVFMATNFGWKAVLGIIITNTIYFFLLRKDLQALKEAYAENRFKKYIQRRFMKQQELEKMMDEIEVEINQKLGFTEKFSEVCEGIKERIRVKAADSLTEEELEKYDIASTLGQRFDNIKKEEMKKSIPGLLPEDQRPPYRDPNWDSREDKVPYWIMWVHVGFMIWAIINAHEPVLFIGGFMFFLGFFQITAYYQNRINLKPALLVAFFLAGLIIHGGVQGWWIAPVLGKLSELPLMLSAAFLTSFNDNAAITYLSTLVTNFSDELKYAVVAGAVTGGGLTIIANAPNPAGQSILKRYFKNGISPVLLLKSALLPTIIIGFCFFLFR